MSNDIFHNGVIDHIEGDKVFVRINQQSACAGCHARSMCSASESKVKMIEVIDRSGLYSVDENVVVCGQSSLGLQAVFLAFIMPLLIIIIAITIGISLGWGESLSGLIGLLLLVPYYYILYLTREKLKKRFIFTLRKHKQ